MATVIQGLGDAFIQLQRTVDALKQTIADRDQTIAAHGQTIAAQGQMIADLRTSVDTLIQNIGHNFMTCDGTDEVCRGSLLQTLAISSKCSHLYSPTQDT